MNVGTKADGAIALGKLRIDRLRRIHIRARNIKPYKPKRSLLPDLPNFRVVGSSHTEMNGMNFPWAAEATSHVAPHQLGYKSVKFITQLRVTDSLKGFGKGLGTALYLPGAPVAEEFA